MRNQKSPITSIAGADSSLMILGGETGRFQLKGKRLGDSFALECLPLFFCVHYLYSSNVL